jgi:diguanylate cyclase (GGDEF)-like protein
MEYLVLGFIVLISSLFIVSLLYNLKQRKIINSFNQSHSSVAEKTFYDSVTNLPNRKNIEIIITENINVATRRNKTFCILALKALDYKDFKSESLEKSNQLSLEITDAILSSIRDEDTAARICDDEYIVVFNEYLELEDFDIPMDRISKALKGKNIRYSYVTFPSEEKTTQGLIDRVLAKL